MDQARIHLARKALLICSDLSIDRATFRNAVYCLQLHGKVRLSYSQFPIFMESLNMPIASLILGKVKPILALSYGR